VAVMTVVAIVAAGSVHALAEEDEVEIEVDMAADDHIVAKIHPTLNSRINSFPF
jgi:hypothetical protein